MKKRVFFFISIILIGLVLVKNPYLRKKNVIVESASGCYLTAKQEQGFVKKSINSLREEIVSFRPSLSGVVERIAIRAGNYGGAVRSISCRVTTDVGAELLPARKSTGFRSSSGASFREINYADLSTRVEEGKTYQIRCKGQDAWNSMYWSFDMAKGKTYRVWGCPGGVSPSPTPTATVTPSVTASPTPTPVSGQKKKIKIIHFSDFGGESPWTMYKTLKYYNGVSGETYFFGSGDYMVDLKQANFNTLRSATNNFINSTRFNSGNVILALGNHDDPGRVMTRMWNQTWNDTRPVEGVVRRGDLIVAWIHTEKPNLDLIEAKIKTKRDNCPKCVAILIGHKPLVLEAGMEAYGNFLLLPGWRERVLKILKDYSFKFYLTGHLEVHSTLTQDGTIHNRATPARRGFEEISFDYDSGNGEVSNIKVLTLDKSLVFKINPLPSPTATGTATVTPSVTASPTPKQINNSCHQECNVATDCQAGQICAKNYKVRLDGRKFCLNWLCPTEVSCVCAWQR